MSSTLLCLPRSACCGQGPSIPMPIPLRLPLDAYPDTLTVLRWRAQRTLNRNPPGTTDPGHTSLKAESDQ